MAAPRHRRRCPKLFYALIFLCWDILRDFLVLIAVIAPPSVALSHEKFLQKFQAPSAICIFPFLFSLFLLRWRRQGRQRWWLQRHESSLTQPVPPAPERRFALHLIHPFAFSDWEIRRAYANVEGAKWIYNSSSSRRQKPEAPSANPRAAHSAHKCKD